MDKIKRATEIYRTMTPHQMALRIVDLEDGISEIVCQAVSEHSKHITELQDALELAEEAVRAKQQPEVYDGWQLVPVEPTEAMLDEFDSIVDFGSEDSKYAWSRMLAAAPKHEGGEA